MASNRDYQLIFRALFDETQLNKEIQGIQAKLNKVTLNLGGEDLSKTTKGLSNVGDAAEKASKKTKKAGDAMKDMALSYQAANAILQTSVDVISAMVDQLFELDAAQVEFSKVSDLSGQALDDYIAKLSEMGLSVARTGKPKCLSLGVGMINLRYTTVQNPVNPKAYLTTMAA